MKLMHQDEANLSSSFVALACLDQAAMDALPGAVYLCAPDGGVVRFNRTAAELWGRFPKAGDPEERFCGSYRLYRTDGAPLPHDQCLMATALRTGESFHNQEVVVEQPGGRRLTVLVNIAALKDEAGRITGAINCFQDITERTQSERRFREMIDALPTAIYTTDAEGRITHFNPAAAAFAGRVPKLGTDEWCVTWKLYHPDGTPMPHDQCPMALALRMGRPILGAEAIAERPDGTRVWFTPYPTPLRDDAGRIVGAINMLVDITERKRGEQHLWLLSRELEHRVKNILTTAIALARLTRAETVKDFAKALIGRLQTLASAQSLLAASRWQGASLQRLIEEELGAFANVGGRVAISGPVLELAPDAAQTVALILHELTTNATKYGALSKQTGRIAVEWDLNREHLSLHWRETGGPAVERPGELGFGSQLIETTLPALNGEIHYDWKAEGLACTVRIPADRLR
ncbi:MAG TPA: PAS domain-containing protein [Dongiaceae bacterium]|nr:PAS domain-containing protein [Dongiaceae bacterium]